jgi:hypothetical protein
MVIYKTNEVNYLSIKIRKLESWEPHKKKKIKKEKKILSADRRAASRFQRLVILYGSQFLAPSLRLDGTYILIMMIKLSH